MSLRILASLSILSNLSVVATSAAACSAPSGEESVEPRVETINPPHQALSTGALKLRKERRRVSRLSRTKRGGAASRA